MSLGRVPAGRTARSMRCLRVHAKTCVFIPYVPAVQFRGISIIVICLFISHEPYNVQVVN
jgi:hypothetical protein